MHMRYRFAVRPWFVGFPLPNPVIGSALHHPKGRRGWHLHPVRSRGRIAAAGTIGNLCFCAGAS